MSNRGYDVVVDVDEEGDLGHTDLQEDNLEFHSSNFDAPTTAKPLPPPNTSTKHTRAPSTGGSGALHSKRYLWSLQFYAQFFDVDTDSVLKRCWAALFPFRTNFLDVLDGNPDLYGPFWIATTVVVILFLTGTISRELGRQGKEAYGYDFDLLSGAAGLVYGYTGTLSNPSHKPQNHSHRETTNTADKQTGIIPLALFFILHYSKCEGASLLETLSLYGYANLIWIPVALISWSPLDILNYIFVGLGFLLSAFFLARNLWPVMSTAERRQARVVLLAVVVLLHAGLAVAIKILFFAHHSIAARGEDAGGKGGGGGKKDGGKGGF
ncbi:MAG: hypothetical protein M1831_003182 [Alyxoria varia]|nr:MAG: hypothetical protein M1831_003182 [Alyxoria varia]